MLESDVEALCPIAKGMVLSTGDAVIGGSCASMMKALCVGGSSSRGGGSIEEAQVDSWMSFGFSNLEVAIETSTDGFDVSSSIAKITSLLSQHLEQQTNKYLVGDSITLADIYITCALYQAKSVGLLSDLSSTSEPLHDYYEHIMSQDCIIQALAILSSIDQPVLPSLSTTTTTQQLNGPPPAVVSNLYKRHRVRIKELLANSSNYLNGPPVTVAGWTRTTRNANKGQLLFIELNDGSSGTSLQCVLESGTTSNFDQSKQSGGAGSSFQFTGTLIESQGDGQDFELKITQSTLLGPVYGGNAQGTEVGGMMYPMSKKAHTLEHMRQHAHLRPRARLHAAAMRIRHAMAFATHNFFHNHGFLYIHTPIVTCADCEGAGEQFGVTTLLGTDHHQPNVDIPVFPPQEEKKLSKKEQKRLAKQKEKEALSTKPIEHKVPGAIDYTQDFFGRRANLTVSGQLNVETHACALSDVYTFGPTFRAENSHTTRHLSEFWMIEPEIAFATLEDDINLAEDYLKYCVQYALEMCADDLEFFENSPFGEAGLRDRLKNVLHSPFKVRTSLSLSLSLSYKLHFYTSIFFSFVRTNSIKVGISLIYITHIYYERECY